MRDSVCVGFLQWALPKLRMRWPGFRKVRGQVCKRVHRRIQQLALDDVAAYRDYLQHNPAEWQTLDSLCRVTISRFYRDKMMYAFLAEEVLPALAEKVMARNETCLNVLSLGCGSGEEPYTIAIIWQLQLQKVFPKLELRIIATDADPNMQRRAEQACYAYGSIKNLPADWQQEVFVKQGDSFCLKPAHRENVFFLVEDVRETIPAGSFDLVLCRNLAFTYFDADLQCEILERINTVLTGDGALVIGVHEDLPEPCSNFTAWSARLGVYRCASN